MTAHSQYATTSHEVTGKLAQLDEHRKTLASKQDIEELKGEIKVINTNMNNFYDKAVSKSENYWMKNMLKTWAIIAGILFPVATSLIIALFNALLSR